MNFNFHHIYRYMRQDFFTLPAKIWILSAILFAVRGRAFFKKPPFIHTNLKKDKDIMGNLQQYNERVADITAKAQHMKDALLTPVIDQGTGQIIGDRRTRNERLEAATKGTIFESCGKGAGTIQATSSMALQSFCNQRGIVPSDELLASAYNAIDNLIQATSGKVGNMNGLIFESAEMSTTEGILMRDRMIALILPVMLNSIVSGICTFIPGQFNQSEIFKIWRMAGSTFGDLTTGDRINWDYTGQYSSMDQRHLTGTGDGSDTGSSNEFRFDSNTVFGKVMPVKKKSVKIIHDGNIVAKDDGVSALSGTFLVGETSVTVTGTVNYTTGTINPIFSVAPATGILVHIALDIDIEKDPTLIPLVTTEMDSRVLYPHESAIAADVTLQALWALRREYNLNADAMAMSAMRNLLSADKDRKVLRDLYFFAKGEETWDKTAGDNAADIGFYYKSLLEALLTVDSTLMLRTGTSGLSGIVADKVSAAIFKAMPAQYFTPVAGYKSVPQPHYVGKLYGMWDLYEDPQKATTLQCLCFAKGRGIGEAGYVMGDAIPAMAFRHAIQRDLTYKNTLWELAYRDLQPFDGREYFMKLTINES